MKRIIELPSLHDPATAATRLREIRVVLDEAEGLLLALRVLTVLPVHEGERDSNADAKAAIRRAIERCLVGVAVEVN